MARIGGNIQAVLQSCETVKNKYGEGVSTWTDAVTIPGWLGMQSGEKKRTNFNAKIEESTHIFLCDFNPKAYALADADTRMIIKGVVYDTLLIDNPDEMDAQLEIYLRKVGAWDGRS